MFKNISIKSKREIKDIVFYKNNPVKKPWALISIWAEKEVISLNEKEILSKIDCNETLSIQFSDLTKEQYDKIIPKPGKLFGEEQAKKIINFIDRTNALDIDELFIHCAAGISRSGAVGTWACRYLNLDEQNFKYKNYWILPNIYVLCTLNKVSGINDDYISFWTNPENKRKREILYRYKGIKNV